jgi:hypothetical protein
LAVILVVRPIFVDNNDNDDNNDDDDNDDDDYDGDSFFDMFGCYLGC